MAAFLDTLDRGQTERVGLDESHVRDRGVGGMELAGCEQAAPDTLRPLLLTEVGGSADVHALLEGEFVERQECLSLIGEMVVEGGVCEAPRGP